LIGRIVRVRERKPSTKSLALLRIKAGNAEQVPTMLGIPFPVRPTGIIDVKVDEKHIEGIPVPPGGCPPPLGGIIRVALL